MTALKVGSWYPTSEGPDVGHPFLVRDQALDHLQVPLAVVELARSAVGLPAIVSASAVELA